MGRGCTDFDRRLFEAGPDAIVVADQTGRIVLLNLRTEALFGYARDELLGKPIEILIPERFASSHAAHRASYFAAPRVRPMKSGLELYARRRDGSEFPVEVSLGPVPTAAGLLVSAGIRDISERVEGERKIRVTQEHLLSAIDSIQGAFAIFDECDRLVLCNSDFRCLFGLLHPCGVEGRSFAELLDDALTAGTFSRGGRTHDELRAMLLDYHRAPSGSLDLVTAGERHLRMIERRTTDGAAVVTIRDVTEDAQRAEQLRQARADAESASAAKSEFLASMSHELRTPLNAILGFAQLLQRDRKSPLSERHRERVDQILSGGEHLLRLIDDVLDLSRIEAGHVSMSLEPVDVAELLIEVKATLDPMAARAGVQIAVAPVPALPYALVDRTRFRQILMNYGTNAIKYNRPGGTATFRASARDGRIRVSVIDDGVGIPEDRQSCIFEPFQRAGQETGPIQGTGIGLTITRRLAELMGGTVGFHSAEGKGSDFWLEVPAHRVDAPGPRSRAMPHRRSTPGAERPRFLVVYIEDNPSNIAFMNHLIGDFDAIQLVTAPSAEIGIEMVRERQPDLVIMDIHLPGMSGVEAARRLREWPETTRIPIVALSAAAVARDRKPITEAGFYRYLTKPVVVDELADVFEEVLGPETTPERR